MTLRNLALLATLAAVATLPAVPEPVYGQTGGIEATVTIPQTPRRRTAPDAYGTDGAARSKQGVPGVAYLEGLIPGAPVPPQAPERTMIQGDTAFVPPALFVPVGGTVEFPNHDPFFHNVFSYSPAQRFDLGRYPRGESRTVTFSEPGLVEVFCEVHDHMRAAIVVVENPFYSEIGPDGRVRFAGVPPGEYRLVVWHPDFRGAERMVEVRTGATTQVEVELRR